MQRSERPQSIAFDDAYGCGMLMMKTGPFFMCSCVGNPGQNVPRQEDTMILTREDATACGIG